MRQVTLALDIHSARALHEALFQHFSAWSADMEPKEFEQLDKIFEELKRQINA